MHLKTLLYMIKNEPVLVRTTILKWLLGRLRLVTPSTLAQVEDKNRQLDTEIATLTKENERLIGMLADPEVLRVEIEKGSATIEMLPPHWAAQLLVQSFAKSIGDAENFITLGVGNDELGYFDITIKRYFGKSPAQVHEEQIAAKDAEIAQLKFQLSTMRDPHEGEF